MKVFEKPLDALGRKKDRYTRYTEYRKKPDSLSQRDLAILSWLNRYAYLRSTWILKLINAPTTTDSRVKARLETMFNGAVLIDKHHYRHGEKFGPFVERPEKQKLAYNSRYQPLVYALSEGGREALRERGAAIVEHSFKKNEFAHSLMICDILADIEIGCRSFPNIRFISREEIMAKAGVSSMDIPVSIEHRFGTTTQKVNTTYIADGWFSLEFSMQDGTKRYRHHCLEVNNADMVDAKSLKVASHLKKFLSLRYIIQNDVLGRTFGMKGAFMPIFVQTKQDATQRSMRLLSDKLDGGRHILFATIPHYQDYDRAPLPDGSTLTREWDTLNGPFRIDRP